MPVGQGLIVNFSPGNMMLAGDRGAVFKFWMGFEGAIAIGRKGDFHPYGAQRQLEGNDFTTQAQPSLVSAADAESGGFL